MLVALGMGCTPVPGVSSLLKEARQGSLSSGATAGGSRFTFHLPNRLLSWLGWVGLRIGDGSRFGRIKGYRSLCAPFVGTSRGASGVAIAGRFLTLGGSFFAPLPFTGTSA